MDKELIQEVVRLACSGKILSAPSYVAGDDVVVEHDFVEAMNWACSQHLPFSPDWGTIRSNEISEVHAIMYAQPGYQEIESELGEADSAIEQCLDEHLPKEYYEAVDNIWGDLNNCLYSRAFMDKDNKFFERLFELYSRGVWPCGWQGNYPSGKLVVFVPK